MTSKLSCTASGEPGRLTIRVADRMPLTPREIIAIGVFLKVWTRIASTKPGAARSITRKVASGVLSRGPKPVPPVVSNKLTSGRSAYSRSLSDNGSRSSERIFFATMCAPISVSSSTSSSPDLSSRSPREQASLAVITTALIEADINVRGFAARCAERLRLSGGEIYFYEAPPLNRHGGVASGKGISAFRKGRAFPHISGHSPQKITLLKRSRHAAPAKHAR